MNKTPAQIAEDFKKTFGVPLSKFWNIAGFDIVKFDVDFLETPDGVSTKDFVFKKYGAAAVQTVLDCLDFPLHFTPVIRGLK